MPEDTAAAGTSSPTPNRGCRFLLLRVYAPPAFAYVISYFFRNANAIIEVDLVRELRLSASDLGLLTSAYFVSFAAFQLPAGLCLDRFGPRRTESCLLVLAAAGALVFSRAESLATLVVGRLLIGLGVSVCLMAAFTSYVSWFPPQRLPLMNSCQMVAGSVGALLATSPLQLLTTAMHWRGVFSILSGVTLAAAAFVLAAHPELPRSGAKEDETLREQLRGLRSVLRSGLFVTYAPLTMFSQAAQLAFLGLWSKPWLRDVAGLDATESARILTYMTLAMLVGTLSLGALASNLARVSPRLTPSVVAVMSMTAFTIPQLLMVLEVGVRSHPLLLMLAFSFLGPAAILPFSALSPQFPKHLAGRLLTAINFCAFGGAFFVQWGIGAVLDQWPPTPSGGYDRAGYQVALAALLAAQGAALLWLLLLAGLLLPRRARAAAIEMRVAGADAGSGSTEGEPSGERWLRAPVDTKV